MALLTPKAKAQESLPSPPPLKIAAGPSGSVYWSFAQEIRDLLAPLVDPPRNVELIETGGSAENMDLVASGSANFGIIQNNAKLPAEYAQHGVAGLCSLYTEAIHIFACNETPLETSADLHGLRIFMGEHGSGTLGDARRTLNSLNVLRTDFETNISPFGELTSLISSKQY